MSNLYEILEVSQKASKEVIDKAYHVLAKKYHPDLQTTDEKKKQAEEKIKKINEAYDILGNEQKRKIYDLKLEAEIEQQKRREQQLQFEELEKNININQRKESFYDSNISQNGPNKSPKEEKMPNIQNSVLGAYKQMYNNYWANRRQKARKSWTMGRFLNLLKGLAIFIIIIIVIWIFPPTKQLLINFYEENTIIKTVVDILGQILIGIVNGIITFFKEIH